LALRTGPDSLRAALSAYVRLGFSVALTRSERVPSDRANTNGNDDFASGRASIVAISPGSRSLPVPLIAIFDSGTTGMADDPVAPRGPAPLTRQQVRFST
jgi:hypothetical protein